MRRLIVLLPVLFLIACATRQNNYDPLEAINRPVFAVNQAVDDAVLRPAAKGYTRFVPPPLRKGVANFFGNLDDLFAIPAALLQGKATPASRSFSRVLINSTLGVGGLIDWASDFPIEKQNEDFGQTLAHWGVSSGPFLMLPLYGPLTLRDSADPLVRLAWGPTEYLDKWPEKMAYYSVYAINTRAQLLPLDAVMQEQIDPYAFIRDSYLQRRWFTIHDGNPPYSLPMGDDLDRLELEPNNNTAAASDVTVNDTPVSEATASEATTSETTASEAMTSETTASEATIIDATVSDTTASEVAKDQE